MEKKHSINDAFTRPLAEQGVEVEVVAPDGETVLGSITVRGADSDAFQTALWRKQRENARILALPEHERDKARKDAERELIAALVAGWTFKETCTPENIKKLFANAPYVLDLVDQTAGKRGLFWTKPRE